MPEKSTQVSPARFNGLYDIVALAASAGGLDALRQILEALPADLPAAIVIVQHLDPNHPSLLATILGRRTALAVKEAQATDLLAPGLVLIAPPNWHLLVNRDGSILLNQSELVRFVRPSADILFESVAANFRERAIAVVLTGSGSDMEHLVKHLSLKGDSTQLDYFTDVALRARTRTELLRQAILLDDAPQGENGSGTAPV